MNLLPLEAEGQLRGTLKKDFHRHRETCAHCREEWEFIQAGEQYLSTLHLPAPALGDSFEQAVMDKIESEPPLAGRILAWCSTGFLVFSAAGFLGFCLFTFQPARFSWSMLRSLYGIGFGLASLLNISLSTVSLAAGGMFLWGAALIFALSAFSNSFLPRRAG